MKQPSAISSQPSVRSHLVFALRQSLFAFRPSLFAFHFGLINCPPSQMWGNLEPGLRYVVGSGSQGIREKPRAKSEGRKACLHRFLASNAQLRVSNQCVLRRLLKQLIAVVAGSLLYFFVLMPHLPPAGRHQPFRIDLGLLVDAWVCLVLYGVIEWVDRVWRRKGQTGEGRKR